MLLEIRNPGAVLGVKADAGVVILVVDPIESVVTAIQKGHNDVGVSSRTVEGTFTAFCQALPPL